MKLARYTIFVILLVIFCGATPVKSYYNPGTPSGFVNDFAGMLSGSEKENLEGRLVQFERDSSNEITVVTIPSLEGDTIEGFAVELFSDWGIGKVKNDNGVLVLIARDDREMRIEVGYGLEGALTDAQSYWIISNIMKPAFREEKYYDGINAALDKIIAATEGEYLPSASTEAEANSSKDNNWEGILWFGMFAFMWLTSILGRSKSWWAGGVIGGVAGVIIGIIKGFLYFGVISIVFLVPFGLLFDFIVSKNYAKGKASGHIPWWIGGGRGGRSGFGGGGFGGFGGGRSGGGGASGGW